jgi:hypothetical protein
VKRCVLPSLTSRYTGDTAHIALSERMIKTVVQPDIKPTPTAHQQSQQQQNKEDLNEHGARVYYNDTIVNSTYDSTQEEVIEPVVKRLLRRRVDFSSDAITKMKI